jgi:hypothetical protein
LTVTAERVRGIRTRRIRLDDEEQRLVDRHLEITGEVEATSPRFRLSLTLKTQEARFPRCSPVPADRGQQTS